MHAYAHRFGPRDVPGWFRMGRGPGRRGRGGPHRRHGFGPGWGGFGPGGPWAGRPRARRGDVRAALLALLAEEPRNGYGLMQEIEQRSDGIWRPSPGSVYPALQQLEDEGLVRVVEQDGRKLYELTDAGRAHVAERGDELAAPWDAVKEDVGEGHREVAGELRQVIMAAKQILVAGTAAQIAEAERVLANARRALYRILADDPPAEDEPSEV